MTVRLRLRLLALALVLIRRIERGLVAHHDDLVADLAWAEARRRCRP